jgi:putative endonuclease
VAGVAEEARRTGDRATVSTNPRPRLGPAGEQLAAEHLQRRGFQILERNFRTRWGELDLVAFDGRVLAFCEVKTRRAGGTRGSALEAVGPRKQAQVRRMAACWLAERRDRPRARQLRMDAIGVTLDARGRLLALEHLEGAF